MIEKNDFYKQPTFPGLYRVDGKYPDTTTIPKTIGPYKVESLLEKGGMSILYLGTHPDTKEPTTIKVLLPKYVSQPEMAQRFLTEAQIIGMTSHPNIVQLYGQGEWEGGLYIAMEFIQGVSLRQYILQNPVSLSKALDIILDIAYALCHLHAHGVIHRDLKPENILITEATEVKVIDFGIAQLLTDAESHGIPKAQLVGTPIYMSPEQRDNPASVSYPSDIYSLGIIAYELILGKLSHGQVHLSLMPKGIQRILYKALQTNPEDRYQDIVDFIADLSAYKNSATMLQEKKAGDPLSEMVESMKLAQMTLVASTPPQWPEMEIGFAGHQGISLSGIYYDFFEIPPHSYGIIMGEASSKAAAEGVIYTAVLRGMVHSLCRLTVKPVELVTILNDIILRDSMKHTFNLNYLIVDPTENKLSYISCGYGTLWKVNADDKQIQKIVTENKPLGHQPDFEFTETTAEWLPGDTLILNTFTTPTAGSTNEFSEAMFEQALKDSKDLNPQKQVENIMRRARVLANKLFQQRSIALVSLRRIPTE